MDQLPLEIFEKILKLCSKHQLEICKKVNRKWYLMINRFEYERLAITDTWIFKDSWFYDYHPIDYNDKIKIKCFESFKFILPDQFKRLKYLFLYSSKEYENGKFKISNMINGLLELENLNLNGIFILKDESINLNSLRTFSYIRSTGNVLKMNTPNLENLRIGYCSSNLDIKFPKKIKYLYVTKMYSEYIEEFCNLEYFYVEHVYTAFYTILKELPRLRELHFDSSSSWATFEIVYKQQQELKRTEFKPFMFGINFKSLDYSKNTDSVNDANKKNFILYKEYPNSIANYLPFIKCFNYNDFEDLFDDEYNAFNIIKKFVDVKELKITRKVNNTNQLINTLRFLSELIEDLTIQSSCLEQEEFFDELPRIIPILNSLSINSENKILDFNFLIKFEAIKKIKLDQYLRTEIKDKLISNYEEELALIIFEESDKLKVEISKNKFTGKFDTHKIKIKKDCLFDSDNDLEDLEFGNLFV